MSARADASAEDVARQVADAFFGAGMPAVLVLLDALITRSDSGGSPRLTSALRAAAVEAAHSGAVEQAREAFKTAPPSDAVRELLVELITDRRWPTP